MDNKDERSGMKERPKKVKKYGVNVWCNEEMDLLRGQECLCLNCKLMNSGCRQAQILYSLCKAFDLALIVTRCPEWKSR
jgi:hypothetical protein